MGQNREMPQEDTEDPAKNGDPVFSQSSIMRLRLDTCCGNRPHPMSRSIPKRYRHLQKSDKCNGPHWITQPLFCIRRTQYFQEQ